MLTRSCFLLPEDAPNDALELAVPLLLLPKDSGATTALIELTPEPRNSNTYYDNDTIIGYLR